MKIKTEDELKKWEKMIQSRIEKLYFSRIQKVRYVIIEHKQDFINDGALIPFDDIDDMGEFIYQQAESIYMAVAEEYHHRCFVKSKKETAEGLEAYITQLVGDGATMWEALIASDYKLSTMMVCEASDISNVLKGCFYRQFDMSYSYILLFTWGDDTNEDYALTVMNMMSALKHELTS